MYYECLNDTLILEGVPFGHFLSAGVPANFKTMF